MKIVKVTRKYQITIPKEIREKLGIRVGDKVIVKISGNKIIIKPVIKNRESPVKHLLSLVKKPIDIDAVKLVEESWDED